MMTTKKFLQCLLILVVQIILLFPQEAFSQIVDSKGAPLPKVVEIFRQYKPLIEKQKDEIFKKRGLTSEQINKILDSKTPLSAISLSQLNDIAQVVFLRPASMERKEAVKLKDKFLPYTNEKVLTLFQDIGDVNTIYPKQSQYRYILLNGSTVQGMRYRIQTLIHFVESKKLDITPKTEIIFLTGDRDLFPEEDQAQLLNPAPLKQNPSWKQPSTFPLTEGQAAQWIWNQIDLPPSLKNAKITFVYAQKNESTDPQTGKVTKKRPTTYDTIKTWVDENNPEVGSCLSVSDQPYVYYQTATIHGFFKKMGLLEKGLNVEGAGTRSDDKTPPYESFKDNIQLFLDNFARTIYTEVSMAKA